MYNELRDVDYFNNLSKEHFPELLGIKINHVEQGKIVGEMTIKKEHFAPNGFLHAGSIVSFADTLAGYASIAHLPDKGKSFTTLEFKSNFVGGAQEGKLIGECVAEHLGRTTHVWRVIISHMNSKKKISVFSCTQLILY